MAITLASFLIGFWAHDIDRKINEYKLKKLEKLYLNSMEIGMDGKVALKSD